MNVLQELEMESYPVKTHFLMKIAHFTPGCHGNEKIVQVFCLETYCIGLVDPKNVHFDTKFIIIALTEAKIWAVLYCCKWWRPF